jgi:hypothetical protein
LGETSVEGEVKESEALEDVGDTDDAEASDEPGAGTEEGFPA